MLLWRACLGVAAAGGRLWRTIMASYLPPLPGVPYLLSSRDMKLEGDGDEYGMTVGVKAWTSIISRGQDGGRFCLLSLAIVLRLLLAIFPLTTPDHNVVQSDDILQTCDILSFLPLGACSLSWPHKLGAATKGGNMTCHISRTGGRLPARIPPPPPYH